MNTQTKEKNQRILLSEKVKSGHAIIRVVSGITRYRIITILKNNASGLTVTDIANILKATPSQISHQLRILKKYDLVFSTPDGRTAIYQLHKEKAEPFLL